MTDPTPRVPGGHPITGHLAFFGRDPLPFLQRAEALGGVVRFRLFVKKGFIISDPAAVRRVLVDNVANYQKLTRGYVKLRLLLGEGLVTSEGDFWLRQRRIAQPAFGRHRLAMFTTPIVRATADLVARWGDGGELEVAEAMNLLALRIAGETLLGEDVTADAATIGGSMLTVLQHFPRLVSAPVPYPERWPGAANRQFWRAVNALHAVVDAVIAERRAQPETTEDLLGLLMAARDPETGEGMSDRQLRDEALTMMLAGHETTANALAWTLSLLADHPDVQARAAAEAAAATPDDGPADLGKVPYLKQIFQEALRLYPPVWLLARYAVGEDTLAGASIPPGAYLFLSPWAIHRSPTHWPEPERFDPDRFAPDRPPPDRSVYLPFSRGRRQCIGDRFAEMEALLVLAALLKGFRFEPVAGQVLIPEPSITLRPRGGLRLRVSPR
ncbi:MAG: cytochrome P450 [Myxococcales bacterium]|nr:cytochrome P450 [Myxococcales bacterium]